MFMFIIIKPFPIFLILFCLCMLINKNIVSVENNNLNQKEKVLGQNPNPMFDQNLQYLAYSRHRSVTDSEKRRGNWDYKANWRHDREAFFSGQTQAQAYQAKNPYGQGGIGYDGDPDYISMRDEINRRHGRSNMNPNEVSENTRYRDQRDYPGISPETENNTYRSADRQYNERHSSENIYYPPARTSGRYDRIRNRN